MKLSGAASALLLGAAALVGPAGAWPDRVGLAAAALTRYDAAVRAHKLARGANVTLQLEDPMPEVLAQWRDVPLDEAARWVVTRLTREGSERSWRPLLAQLYGRQGRASEAVAVLEEHVKLFPDHAEGFNALGVACARLGAAGAGRKLACYEQTVKLDPKNATGWANLCNALAAAGKPREAVAAGLHAVSLRAHYVYAWMNLGVAYGLLNDAPREKEAYRNAIEVPPGYEQCPFARFNLGLCYEKDKDYAAAVALYRDALRVGLPQGPGSRHAALFHHNLARALFLAGDYAAATGEATEALKIEPRLPEPHSLLGHLFEKAGQPAASRRMFVIATRLLKKYGASAPDAPLRHGE